MARIFTHEIKSLSTQVLETARAAGMKIATAESCTGGLISASLTEIAGSSDVFDRAFITYSNEAKHDMLGVSIESLERFGAVSRAVAGEMAYGALTHSQSDIAVAVTGIAGPGGGTAEKPVGLVWFGICQMGQAPTVWKKEFGDIGRSHVRGETVIEALSMLLSSIKGRH